MKGSENHLLSREEPLSGLCGDLRWELSTATPSNRELNRDSKRYKKAREIKIQIEHPFKQNQKKPQGLYF